MRYINHLLDSSKQQPRRLLEIGQQRRWGQKYVLEQIPGSSWLFAQTMQFSMRICLAYDYPLHCSMELNSGEAVSLYYVETFPKLEAVLGVMKSISCSRTLSIGTWTVFHQIRFPDALITLRVAQKSLENISVPSYDLTVLFQSRKYWDITE